MGKRTQRRKITERQAVDPAEPDPGFFFTELDPDPGFFFPELDIPQPEPDDQAQKDEAPALVGV